MLDLGCGPCVFARRGVQAGYRVTAVDGRTERIPADLDPAITFVHEDVREFPAGEFDVVTNLGLLYHLDLEDQVALVAKHSYATTILDTQVHFPEAYPENVGAWAQQIVARDGYEGVQFPEGDNPMASIGNPLSFWHTEPSLLRLIEAAGFSSCTIIDPLYVSKYGARKFFVLHPQPAQGRVAPISEGLRPNERPGSARADPPPSAGGRRTGAPASVAHLMDDTHDACSTE